MSNNKKYNVLFIYTDTEFGGGGRFFGQVIRGLTPRGFRFVVGCRQNAPIKNFYDEKGIENIPFEVKNRFDIINMLRFCGLIKKYKFDIACLGDGTAWTTGIILSLFSNVNAVLPIVHMTHIGLEHKEKYGWFERTIFKIWDRLWAHFATKILVSNQKNTDILVGEGVDRKKISIICNFPDVDSFNPEVAKTKEEILGELKIPYSKTVIGTMARLGPGKDFDNLFKSIKKVVEIYTDCHFIIVGDGPYREKFEKQVKNLKIDDYITFAGFRKNSYEFLNIFDIVVLSTLSEGVPNIILEGMAFAKPIVSTDSGAVSDAVYDNETGILVPPRNPEKFAEGIIKLLNDEELCKRLGENAKILVSEKFTKEKMWDGFEKLFLSMITELK